MDRKRPHPGHAEADVDLSVRTEIGLACRLPGIGADEAVFAAVRLFAAGRLTEPTVQQLADVRMEIVSN